MYKQLHVNIEGYLLNNISSNAVYIAIDATTAATLQAALNFAGGEWTYLLLDNGVYSEEIKVTEVNAGFILAERGMSDSTPQVFAAVDTIISSTFGKAAVEDSVQQAPQSIDFTLAGTGIAVVSGPANARIVHVDEPVIVGDSGVEVMGAWPNITIGLTQDAGGCCPGEGTGGTGGGGALPVDGTAVTSLSIGSTILQGSIANNILSLSLATPAFSGAGGIAVTGTWPNYVISGAGISGGGAGITVAVGTGLSLTGSPTINPTISLMNTGVTAGDYSGFVVNAQGQITNLPANFAFIKSLAVNYGSVNVVASAATLTINDADVGVRGAVAMTNPAIALNPADEDTAVSPAILAAQLSGVKGTIVGSMSGEADVSYTNSIGSTTTALVLAAGQKVILIGEVCVTDNAVPTTPIAYGVSVFGLEGAVTTKLYSSKIVTQSKQPILGFFTGPFTGSIAIVTTTLPGASTLQGAHLAFVKAN